MTSEIREVDVLSMMMRPRPCTKAKIYTVHLVDSLPFKKSSGKEPIVIRTSAKARGKNLLLSFSVSFL